MKRFRVSLGIVLVFVVVGCAELRTTVPGPWWAWPKGTGVTTCGFPATYRIDGGHPQPLGSCAAILATDPAVARLRVGQELDLHMATEMTTDGTFSPLYLLPSSPDESVLGRLGVSDGGSTGRFQANGSGAVTLMTTGWCIDSRTGAETQGACPLLRVRVTP